MPSAVYVKYDLLFSAIRVTRKNFSNNKDVMSMVKIDKNEITLRCISLFYIGLIIILPIIAIISKGLVGGLGSLWSNITMPQALYSLRLTLLCSFTIVLINILTGTLTAWVLVRYNFPFKDIMDSIIDIPFAIPTVVTGIMLMALYGPKSLIGSFLTTHNMDIIFAKPGIILALLFVTFPFVIRSVQPVLLEMEPDMEEAAKTLGASNRKTFFKIILPALTPSILTGAALSFSRALGEFGSIVIIAGNIPFRTQVASVFIYGEVESYNQQGAIGLSIVLLFVSFFILVFLNLIQKWTSRHEKTG